jgi:hypothetical protein
MELDLAQHRQQAQALLDVLPAEKLTVVRSLLEVTVEPLARSLKPMQILHCIDRYFASREGDVKKLKPPLTGFRLRCADYRVFFY